MCVFMDTLFLKPYVVNLLLWIQVFSTITKHKNMYVNKITNLKYIITYNQ